MSGLPSGITLTETTGLTWQLANISQDSTSFVSNSIADGYDKVGYSSALGGAVSDNVYFTVKFTDDPTAQKFAYVGLTQTMTSTDPVDQNSSKIDIGLKRDGTNVFVVINGSENAAEIAGDASSEYTIIQRSTKFDVYVKTVSSGTYNFHKQYDCPLRTGASYALAMAIYYGSTSVQISGGTTSEVATFSVPSAPSFMIDSYSYNVAFMNITPPTSDGNTPIIDYELRIKAPGQTSFGSQASLGLTLSGVTYTFPEQAGTYQLKLVAVNNEGGGTESEIVNFTVNLEYNPTYYLYPLVTGGYNLHIAEVTGWGGLYTKNSQPPLFITILDSNNAVVTSFEFTGNDYEISAMSYGNNYTFKFADNPVGTIPFDTIESISVGYAWSEESSTSAKIKIENASFSVYNTYIYQELSVKIYSSKDPDPVATIPYSSFNTDFTISGLTPGAVNTFQLKVFNSSTGLLSNSYQEIQIITLPNPTLTGFVYPVRISTESYALFSNGLSDGSLIGNASIPILLANGQNTGQVMNPTVIYTAFLTPETTYTLSWSGKTLDFTTNEYFLGTITYEVSETSAAITVSGVPKTGSGYGIYAVNENDADYDITGFFDFKLELWSGAGKVDEKAIDGSASYTFNVTDLTGETAYTDYFLKVTGYSTLNNASGEFVGSDQQPLSFTTTAAGGGGGGGGGNNGGNGHNNMATLELAYTGYEGDVSQTNTITILGEEGGSLSGVKVTLDVPLADFKKVLQYQSNWTTEGDAAGTQPLPDVWFRPLEASSALSAMYTGLNVLGTGAAGSDGRKWTDSADAKISVFGDTLLGISFTSSALDSANLPRESIRQIEEGSLSSTDLAQLVKNLDSTVAPAAGKPEHKALLEGLFEQAVSAGRVKASDSTTGAQVGYKCPSFEVGDEIAFLVKYTFTKERDYKLDSDVTSGNTIAGARKTFMVAGQTFDVDGDNETASTSVTYIVTLRAAA